MKTVPRKKRKPYDPNDFARLANAIMHPNNALPKKETKRTTREIRRELKLSRETQLALKRRMLSKARIDIAARPVTQDALNKVAARIEALVAEFTMAEAQEKLAKAKKGTDDYAKWFSIIYPESITERTMTKANVSTEPTIVGYWYSKHEPQYPKPKARDKKWKGHSAFVAGLIKLQSGARAKHFKGMSECRCCGKRNGSGEYHVAKKGGNYRWPDGLMHYVVAHNVKPPNQEFVDWVISFAPKKLRDKLQPNQLESWNDTIQKMGAKADDNKISMTLNTLLKMQPASTPVTVLPHIDDVSAAFHTMHMRCTNAARKYGPRKVNEWEAAIHEAHLELQKTLDRWGIASRIDWTVRD